jgi:nitrous oxidase accessory protein
MSSLRLPSLFFRGLAALWLFAAAPCGAAAPFDLQAALDAAAPGAEIELPAGVYEGHFTISRPVRLAGAGEAVISAQGKGTAVTVKASNVLIRNLTIRDWGEDLYERDAAVRIEDESDAVEIDGVRLYGAGFGIRADNSTNIRIRKSFIEGNRKKHVLDRGDGVFFKAVRGAELTGNTVRFTRDGFYFEESKGIDSRNNRFLGLQYGIHFMYDDGDSASGNKAEAVRGGYAVMNSRRITLTDNESRRNIEFGILLNVSDGSVVRSNFVEKVKNPRGRPELDTEGKALFIYGGGANEVSGNVFRDSDIGIAVALGGEGTQVFRNAVLHNRSQVRYVGTGSLEWSRDGVGNYWSNYQGWDLDGDGVGDRPFQPNDSLDRLFWIYPEARFLMESPLVVVLKFLAAQFEMERGRGVTDSHPLMTADSIPSTSK